MGWANVDPPQLRNRLTDFDETRILELISEVHPPRKMSFQSDDVGGLGEYPVCHCCVSVFVVLSFFWSLRHVHRSHQWTDFYDLCVIWRLSAHGPRTQPCGTPLKHSLYRDEDWPARAHWDRRSRYEQIDEKAVSEMPKLVYNLLSNTLCSTMSKAELGSIETKMVGLPWSQWSVNIVRRV